MDPQQSSKELDQEGRFSAEAGCSRGKGKTYTQKWIETLFQNRHCREASVPTSASAPSWNTSNSDPAKVDRAVNKETFLQRCSDDSASEPYSLAPVIPRNVPADEVVYLLPKCLPQYPGHCQNCKPVHSSEWMGRAVTFTWRISEKLLSECPSWRLLGFQARSPFCLQSICMESTHNTHGNNNTECVSIWSSPMKSKDVGFQSDIHLGTYCSK